MHFKSHSAFQDGRGTLKPVTAVFSLHHKYLCLAAFPPVASNRCVHLGGLSWLDLQSVWTRMIQASLLISNLISSSLARGLLQCNSSSSDAVSPSTSGSALVCWTMAPSTITPSPTQQGWVIGWTFFFCSFCQHQAFVLFLKEFI